MSLPFRAGANSLAGPVLAGTILSSKMGVLMP